MLLLYSKISEHFHENIIEKYLNYFDKDFQRKILSYRRWQDAQLSLIGRVLLLKLFEENGISSDEINNIHYNKFGKPFLKGNSLFFNISHSSDIVVCVISNKCEIGIDIEVISDIEISDFESQFTEKEWNKIISSNNKKDTFFDYWTQKEAVVKANGNGLMLSLKSFDILENKAVINGENYYLKEIKIDEQYKCYISKKMNIFEISIKEISIG
ncbi:4'-phosphopantetheinyl transferase family protein [Flavobacterium sp. ZB4P13]|uniref:4'-phosphopantetheinyl transferase family protein n=1 Tax=Flavobacterium sp. ZB4P13 TaxID=3401728 RepID=UPI003AABC77A